MKIFEIIITGPARSDIRAKRDYILHSFQYREYVTHYLEQIRKGGTELGIFPKSGRSTGFTYRDREIYMKPTNTELLFYCVDEDAGKVYILRVLQQGMDWESVIKVWLSR